MPSCPNCYNGTAVIERGHEFRKRCCQCGGTGRQPETPAEFIVRVTHKVTPDAIRKIAADLLELLENGKPDEDIRDSIEDELAV